MRKATVLLSSLLCLLSSGQLQAAEASSPLDSVNWLVGPATGSLADRAEVKIPSGFVFAGADDTRKLMEVMENPVSGEEVGFLGPENLDWYIVFEYEDSGHVKDDEKDSLDANAMLVSIREGNDRSNEERRKRGWAELTVTGWAMPPRYNEGANRLEWAIQGEAKGEKVVNHNTRLLGREGLMRVTLVISPDGYASVLPNFDSLLSGFNYKSGHQYAEYKQGDKLAKYGLSALVVGGAAAAAAKTGVFKWIWKFLVVGGVAIASFFKRIFGRSKS